MTKKVNMIVVLRGFNMPVDDKSYQEISDKEGRLLYRIEGNLCHVHITKDDNCIWVCNKLEQCGLLQEGTKLFFIHHREGINRSTNYEAHKYEEAVKSGENWNFQEIQADKCKELYENFVLGEKRNEQL